MLRRLLQNRTRRGSVLIFVVALLVLLALIGTAWISTTRNDRYSTQQNAVNTSIELLTQGVVDMTAARATADLFTAGTPVARPAGVAGYRHFDGPDLNVVGLEGDGFLASRYPRVPNVLRPLSATNRPYWPVINTPPTGGSFEAPFVDDGGSPFWNANVLAFPLTKSVNGRNLPALAVMDGPTRRVFVAGDADGDGIADAGLFRLPINDVPVGQINGFASNQITWYAATRTVDLAAAVNVNTAMFRSADFASDGLFVNGLPLDVGFFASNLGLGELLRSHNPVAPTTGYNAAFVAANPELTLVQQYRTNVNTGLPSGIQTSAGTASPPGPVDELNANRTDFDYFSLGDALHAGLARRVENPGYSLVGRRFQTYPLSTELSLASRFILRPRGSSATRLERDLADSLVGGLAADNGIRDTAFSLVRSEPYADVLAWFDDNFAYEREDATSTATWLQRRPLLTTFSRTSNLAPYRPLTGTLPVASWPAFPTDARSPRTSINTASFDEKWRNFWFVMTSPDGNTPYGADPASLTVADQYVGMRFGTTATPPPGTDPLPLGTPLAGLTPAAYNVPTSNLPMDPATAEQHPFKMFRSPLRPVPSPNPAQGTYILPSQMALLRSAIAAVNADDLIDADLSSRRQQVTVQGVLNGTVTPMTVTIYGNEAQPVLAEVYVNTKTDDQNLPATVPGPNAVPYVALKLYNPTDVPIQMDQVPGTTGQGWQIAGMQRKTLPPYRFPAPGARGPLRIQFWDPVQVVRQGTVPPPLPGEVGVVIPAQGYLLLENYKDDGTGSTLYRPTSSNLPPVGEPTLLNPNVRRAYVRDLHLLLDHELILMRLSDPAPTPPPDDLLNLGWAPIDSFDLTGLLPGTPTLATVWHYARPSGPGLEQAGRGFYPGRYRADLGTRRQQGTHAATWDPSSGPAGVDPFEVAPSLPAVSLVGDNLASFPRTFPVQLASPSFRSAANRFPFGGFMRDLDLLAIPFVAAYRVQDEAGNLLEINPVTMDLAFAEDTDLETDWIATDATALREQVGRFAPLYVPTTSTNAPAAAVNDFAPGLTYGAAGTERWRYAWTKSLLDYFTTQAPHDDFTPNVPQPMLATTPPLTTDPQPVRQRPGTPAGNRSLTTIPANVSNFSEDTVPRYGLVNLNTANAKVLGLLPWLPAAGDAATGFFPLDVLHYERPSDDTPAGYFGAKRPGDPAVPDNEDLGRLIEDYRDGVAVNAGTYRAGFEPRGPFTSLYDLYAIPGFRDAQAAVLLAADPDDRVGDFSPPNPAPASALVDNVRFDYEESYLMLNRVSNLVTVRSDAYVLYVLVQGWANAGTPTARPVIERRAAFLMDRSGITTLDRKPQLFRIPAD